MSYEPDYTPMEAQMAVHRGAARLDEEVPGWYKIVGTLDVGRMRDSERCVYAAVYPLHDPNIWAERKAEMAAYGFNALELDWERWLDAGRSYNEGSELLDTWFGYLADAWNEEITQRMKGESDGAQ